MQSLEINKFIYCIHTCICSCNFQLFLDCLRYEVESFGVKVSLLEPGNFIAGTNIFNEKFVKAQADMMWENMDEEVKEAYGRKHFDQKVLLETDMH